MFHGKLLIFRLPSVQNKNYGSPARATRLKVATNMADPTGIKHQVGSINKVSGYKVLKNYTQKVWLTLNR